MLYLPGLRNAPNEEIKEAKEYAKGEVSKCYGEWAVKKTENRKNYHLFEKWFFAKGHEPEQRPKKYIFAYKYIYLIETQKECPNCKKNIPVVALGIKNHFIYDTEENRYTPFITNEPVRICLNVERLRIAVRNDLLGFLKSQHNVNYHSRTLRSETTSKNTKEWGHFCPHCDKFQGKSPLIIPKGPFCIDTVEAASKLTLYKINLQYNDIVLYDAELLHGKNDELIEEYGKIVPSDFEPNLEAHPEQRYFGENL